MTWPKSVVDIGAKERFDQSVGTGGCQPGHHHFQVCGDLPAEMDRLAPSCREYPVVMEMYGVGDSLGPQLMAEIGDVRCFERKQSLVAFAGIDPMPNQSGEKMSAATKPLSAVPRICAKRCSM